MKKIIPLDESSDIRQSVEWGRYLEKIGWTVERIGDVQIDINRIPLFGRSLVKIQHPWGVLPFREIDALAKKQKALFVLIEPSTSRYDGEILLKEGYRQSNMRFAPTSTIKLDLSMPEKELFASFSENARRNSKKSQKLNVTVKTVWMKDETTDSAFEEFYSLHSNLARMKHFYAPSHDHFQKKMSAMKEISLLLFAYEEGNESPIASVWYSVKDHVMTYMHTGITQRGYEQLANYLLVWEGMKVGQKNDVHVFDFEIIFDERYPKEHRNWLGYTEFKKRFHGTIVEYPPTWVKFYSPMYKLFYLCTSRFH